ncbi:acyl--CoA ligase [Aneurinibacillus sp. BA2021]|nr:acyl--CoA ligase [Aneurinibacillus sp. BA2021]
MKLALENHFGRELKVFARRPKTITEMLACTCTSFPEKEALIAEGERMTYRTLGERIEYIAGNLSGIYGVQKGDRIALLIGNRIEFVLLIFACARIGAIAVILNTRLKEKELAYMLSHSGASLLCFDEECREKVERLQQEAAAVSVRHFFLIDGTGTEKMHLPFEILLQPAEAPRVHVRETDPLFIMYTSGTTGVPKGAVISHLGAIHGAMSYEHVMCMNEQAKTLIAVPLFHVTGLVGQLLHMIRIGGTSVLMKKYKTGPYIRLLVEENITFLFNVPTIYVMIMSHPEFSAHTYHAVRTLAFGGAPISLETIRNLKRFFPGAVLHNAYGATETSSPTTIMPPHVPEQKLQSVGMPIPVANVKVVNADQEECAPGEVGELLVKSPTVIEGYWDNEEATKRSFADGFWRSGDMAMIDKDGFVYIMDRMKDMINRGGEKVFSVEVENVLYHHPSVLEAAVVGAPDQIFGEIVQAFIVLKDGATAGAEDIRRFVREHLAEYKVPAIIEFLDELPRNPGGKIMKSQLKKGFLAGK